MANNYIIGYICDECIYFMDSTCKNRNSKRYNFPANYKKCKYYTLKIFDTCFDCMYINKHTKCKNKQSPKFNQAIIDPERCEQFVSKQKPITSNQANKVDICTHKNCPWMIKCDEKYGTCMWTNCIMEDDHDNSTKKELPK